MITVLQNKSGAYDITTTSTTIFENHTNQPKMKNKIEVQNLSYNQLKTMIKSIKDDAFVLIYYYINGNYE